MSLCQIKRSTKDRVSFCHQVHLHSQKSVTNICHFVPIQLPIWLPQGLFDWDSYLMLFNTQLYPDFIPISEISKKKPVKSKCASNYRIHHFNSCYNVLPINLTVDNIVMR